MENLNTQDNLASVILYEGNNDTLIYKHPAENFTLGSQLIVHESQEAIFFRDGQALDLFGAGRYTLETQLLPKMDAVYKLPTDTKTTFHSEVYFCNKATLMGVKWGTDSKVRLFDPATGMHVELGASGEFNIRVSDFRRLLLKVVGTSGGLGLSQLLGTADCRGVMRAMVMTQVKAYLAQTIKDCGIAVLEIDAQLLKLSEALRDRINEAIADYGLFMPEFFISRIVTPDDDPNFKRLRQQYADRYLAVQQEEIRKLEAEAAQKRREVEAQTEAHLRLIGAQAEAEAYKMKAEAEAEAMRMKGYTYSQETARMVGMEAMQNGIGGSGGSSIGDVAGLGVALGAMGGIAGMTKDVVEPMLSGVAAPKADGWDCPTCGTKQIPSAFCPNCGTKKPLPAAWNCPACGKAGITSRFCPDCGAKQPQ